MNQMKMKFMPSLTLFPWRLFHAFPSYQLALQKGIGEDLALAFIADRIAAVNFISFEFWSTPDASYCPPGIVEDYLA